MTRRIRDLALALAVPVVLAAFAAAAHAQDVADFYRGKRITLVLGYGPGGGYDLYARMLARFIGAHIPGNPFIVPQNMPGAGSRSAANWLFKVAPRDGTVIACLSQGTPADQVLKQPGVQFDARKFNWIGNLNVVNNVLYVSSASGVATLAQAKTKPLSIGASGAPSPSVIYPQVSNNLLGTKFRIIAGYPGGADINVAVERRELDGRGSDSWDSLKATRPEWLRNHFVNILFQVGPRREHDLPDVPPWTELAENDEQRSVLSLLSGDVSVGRPVLTAPDVPADRIAALRRAFEETVRDPRFLAAAKEANLSMNPMFGEQLQRVVDNIVSSPPDVVAKVKTALAIKDVRRKDH
jgi:tripartite-type tricarboxylate transporter receptor subunit TctC